MGGDYQGKNPDILNAEYNFVDPQVTIKADSLGQGSGGKVIFWSNKATHFYGSISAQGGPLGGDGGFVEVSGDYLDYQGMTNLLAPLGKTGTLLLDPTNITFSTTDSGWTVPTPNCSTGYVLSGNPATANVSISNLMTNLGTCNVTISTASGAGSAGTMTIADSLTVSSNLLTLTANGSFSTASSATLTTSGTGSIAITAVNTSGSTAISIAGPLTLACLHRQLFSDSHHRQYRHHRIITSTVSAPFSLSAPGAAGSITPAAIYQSASIRDLW